MLRFKTLLKLQVMMIAAVLFNYSLWCGFFILQGKAIDLAINKNNVGNQLIYTLAGFISIKMMVMLCDVFQQFTIEHYKNAEIKLQWNQHAPKQIHKDNEDHINDIGILFFDYLPRLYDSEITITKNNVTVYYIFTLTVLAFIYSDFVMGIVALLLVFSFNYLSKNIFTEEIDRHHIEINTHKIKILNWVDQYFRAYREISKNWPGITHSTWKDGIYSPYYISKKNQTFLYLYRDLLSQLLVELPFLLNTSIVIVGVYYGYLSLTQLFVWVGFSQFMINASNAYLENKVIHKQRDTLIIQSNTILSRFESKTPDLLIKDRPDSGIVAELTLRDGSKNTLSLVPGIYHIRGENGSGKSTLLNIILDYQHDYDDYENINLSKLLTLITQENIRVIERDVVIFECLDDINGQICGPFNNDSHHWEQRVTDAMNHLLDPALSKKWMDIFTTLATDYATRNDNAMSSGERIILSMLRFFSSWDKDVNLLIIDECDSFLDSRKRILFMEAIDALAAHMAIYICTHDASLQNEPLHRRLIVG